MIKAHNHFGSSNGSEKYYYHQPSKVTTTFGVKQLVYACSAYWLIYLIISYQCKRNVKREPFQVSDLKRVKDNRFTMIASDGNNNRIA